MPIQPILSLVLPSPEVGGSVSNSHPPLSPHLLISVICASLHPDLWGRKQDSKEPQNRRALQLLAMQTHTVLGLLATSQGRVKGGEKGRDWRERKADGGVQGSLQFKAQRTVKCSKFDHVTIGALLWL